MRLTNAPMTAGEFQAALDEASRGVVSTDNGANDAITEALDAVAEHAPNPPAAIVAAARAAYHSAA